MARPKMSERAKVDIGLVPQTINNSNVTGAYYDMRGWRKALAIAVDGASAVNKATTVEFVQATAAAGTGAKVVKQGNASAGTESKAVSTAAAAVITAVTECTITMNTALNTEAIIINGITFTAHTDTTTAASRQFKIDGDDTADAVALAGLINNATYGVPGVTATPAAAVITLTSTEAGKTPITVDAGAAVAKMVPAITKQILYCECDVSDLDLAGGFYWLAVKVTKAGNGIVGATLVREPGDYPRGQKVAAGTVI